MTTTVSPIPVDAAQPSLQSFRDLAGGAQALLVRQDMSGWSVAAADAAVAKGTETDADIDTTAVFVQALGRAFTRGIQEAVVRELDLQPRPGQPLAASLVLQAIAMAEASEQALQGVDFMTQLQFSAMAHAAEFDAACRAAGMATNAISTPQRAAIDARMQQRFAEAAQQRQVPVTPETARQWLHAELTAPGAHTS